MTIHIRVKVVFGLLAALIVIATIYYNATENWGLVDSLYFTVSTATTVGYGDIVPTTKASKTFTVVFMILSTGMLLYGVGLAAQHKILIHLKKKNEIKISKTKKSDLSGKHLTGNSDFGDKGS